MKRQHFLFTTLLALLVLISACKREPERAKVISKLRGSAKLATVEYVVTKVISAKARKWFGKDEHFFARTEATITAGIDMTRLTDEDIKTEGTKISITLPPIEIVNFDYPADAVKVVDSYTYGPQLKMWNKLDLEKRDKLFREGEIDIRNSIRDLNITKTAQNNAILLLTPIVESVGFEEVYIQFEDEDSLELEKELEYIKREFEKLKEKED